MRCLTATAMISAACFLTFSSSRMAIRAETLTSSEGATRVFRAPRWGIVVRYSDRLIVTRTFKKDYFDRGEWRMSYAAGAGAGDAVVAFSLPDRRTHDAGGNSEATAELTIGASHNPQSLSNCLSYGLNSGNDVVRTSRTIGGVVFMEVPDNADGGMQQTIQSDDLRAVHDGVCWAIDLRLYTGGTSNVRPVFPASDIAELKQVLDGISFVAPEPISSGSEAPTH